MLDLSFRFDLWYARLPKSPRDEGTVSMLVQRTGPGERATPEQVEVEPGRGVLGDAWATHEHSLPGNEISLMNVHVLRSLVDDAARMPLAGDNLLVDLELSEENLPVGTRLQAGDAVLVVSPAVHRPCAKFVERFGAGAARRSPAPTAAAGGRAASSAPSSAAAVSPWETESEWSANRHEDADLVSSPSRTVDRPSLRELRLPRPDTIGVLVRLRSNAVA